MIGDPAGLRATSHDASRRGARAHRCTSTLSSFDVIASMKVCLLLAPLGPARRKNGAEGCDRFPLRFDDGSSLAAASTPRLSRPGCHFGNMWRASALRTRPLRSSAGSPPEQQPVSWATHRVRNTVCETASTKHCVRHSVRDTTCATHAGSGGDHTRKRSRGRRYPPPGRGEKEKARSVGGASDGRERSPQGRPSL